MLFNLDLITWNSIVLECPQKYEQESSYLSLKLEGATGLYKPVGGTWALLYNF